MGRWTTVAGVVVVVVLTVAAAAGAFNAPHFSKLASETREVRYAPFAATLPDGNVLVAGNNQHGPGSTTAEVFNAKTGVFEALSGPSHELQQGRGEAAAVALQDGEVLIVGGYSSGTNLATAELFNPTSETFTLLSAHLVEERDAPAVALLQNGDVLIADGCQVHGCARTAEIYEPKTNTFTKLASQPAQSRYAPATATLPNGNVLIAGSDESSKSVATAEIYNAHTGAFELLTGAAHEMHQPRGEASAVTLQDGKVLIIGGWNTAESKALKSVEIFNPVGETFEPSTSELVEARDTSASALLHDGRVLVAGGCQQECETSAKSAEITAVGPPSRATTGRAVRRPRRAVRISALVQAETVSTVYFQFGTSRRYGHRTKPQVVAASEVPVTVTALLKRLAPGRRYHFRVVIENFGGRLVGADRTFKVPKRR